MLWAIFYFWNKTTNNFHLRYGMTSPTLCELAVITGLQSTGELLVPTTCPNGENSICNDDLPYNNSIENNFDDSTNKVSLSENISFLSFWLNAFIFCNHSFQIHKVFEPLVGLIHEESKFSLSKLLLPHFYNLIVDTVESLQAIQDTTNLRGPFWIL